MNSVRGMGPPDLANDDACCSDLTVSAVQWVFLGVGLALEAVIAWAWLVSPRAP